MLLFNERKLFLAPYTHGIKYHASYICLSLVSAFACDVCSFDMQTLHTKINTSGVKRSTYIETIYTFGCQGSHSTLSNRLHYAVSLIHKQISLCMQIFLIEYIVYLSLHAIYTMRRVYANVCVLVSFSFGLCLAHFV